MLTMGFLYTASTLHAQDIKLKTVWESDTTLSVAESILFDRSRNVLYVSCVNGQATNENSKSFIAKVGLDGRVIDLNFTENLNATKGMCLWGDKLFVTEMRQVVEIDLTTGKVVKRYPVEGAVFLNDLALDSATGSIYITDSGTEQLSVLHNGETKVVGEGAAFKQMNALLLEGTNLLIGSVAGTFSSLDLKTAKLTPVAVLASGIDGITALGNNSYLLAETAGRLWHLRADGTKLLLSDTSKDNISAADTDYDPTTHMVYVPTLFHNTIRAIKLQ